MRIEINHLYLALAFVTLLVVDMAHADPLTLGSESFCDHCAIPALHTADGEDLSPPLQWEHTPDRTKELVLIVDDPDAQSNAPWVHWLVYGIPAGMHDLPRGVPRKYEGVKQGQNSWRTIGYRGPSPPPGKMHHYRFALYAVDTELELTEGVELQSVLNAMQGHILERRILTGTYGR